MRKRSLVSGTALALFLVCSATAQVTARLSGSVVDQTGSAVPIATVDVFLPGGARPILTSNTTQEGLFAFAGVPAGTYDVVITANGFRKHSERGVVLAAATETAIPAIKLEVGSVTDVVEVKESNISVQTTNSEISLSIGRQQIQKAVACRPRGKDFCHNA